MGGLFLHTPTPLPPGSFIELLFDLKSGEIRARATVRHSAPGRGMGIQFVQMTPADRSRLHQFLSKFEAAETILTPGAAIAPGVDAPGETEAVRFERELNERLEIARKGTYYQVLEIPPDSDAKQIKESFYSFARKFHPDHHMDKKQWLGPLKELMVSATTAYKVLSDHDQKTTYDLQLADSGAFQLGRAKSAAQKNLDEYFGRATDQLRGNNFVGSVLWLRKCVEIAPGEAKYRALLARSLGTIPQYREEAIEQFEWAIQLDTWNVTVLGQFAQLCEEMEMSSRAQELYTKILQIDPRDAQARARLAELEGEQKTSRKFQKETPRAV